MRNWFLGATVALTLTLCISSLCATAAGSKIDVVTSNTTCADFVKEIGGSKVEVDSIARGTQDLHYVEPRPSFVTRLRDADMVVVNGLSFEVWMLPLLDSARNPKITTGAKGYVDASHGIRPLEVPSGRVSMQQGELHPLGNPHYLLDPRNAKIAAKNVLDGLVRVSSSGDAAYFRSNYDKYIVELNKKIDEWKKEMAPHKGKPVVTYHKSWTYFLDAFDLIEFGTVEPKPAIPPSPSHVNDLIKEMRAKGVKAILKEPYFPNKFPSLIAKQTNSTLLILPEWVGGVPEADTYTNLMDYLVRKVSNALK